MNCTDVDIDKVVYEKFSRPLNKNCKSLLREITSSSIKHRETIGLLFQSYNTIENVIFNLKKYNFVDANALLRSAFEYLVMAIMIEENKNVYDEFIKLSNNDIKLTRKYTIINTLLEKFGKNLNKISPSLFGNVTSEKRKKIIIDFYDLLCKYTHANLVVTVFCEIKDNKEKEVLKLLMYYNVYFIKIILLDSLKYLTNNIDYYIDEETIGFCLIFNLVKIFNIIQDNDVNFEKIRKLLYYDSVNNEFYKYNFEGMEHIKQEVSNDIEALSENINDFKQKLDAFLNKK